MIIYKICRGHPGVDDFILSQNVISNFLMTHRNISRLSSLAPNTFIFIQKKNSNNIFKFDLIYYTFENKFINLFI